VNLDQALRTFIEESRDLLAAMEDALLGLEDNPGDAGGINAVFRAMHTIKGSAGLFGLDHIVSFTHVAESVMDRVRDGDLAVDDKLAALLLACRDHIGNLVDRVASGEDVPDPDVQATGDTLMADLRTRLDGKARLKSKPKVGIPTERVEAVSREGGGLVENDTWHISVRFDRDLFRNGFDPLSFVLYLGTLGQLVHVETVADALPEAADMDPESCYLGFEIRLAAQVEKFAIESAFQFVRDDCSLSILPPHSHISEYIRLIESLPEDSARVGEILLACGALTARELEVGLRLQEQQSVSAVVTGEHGDTALPPHPLGEILVERGVVQPEVVGAALSKQQRVREAKSRDAKVIRVDSTKLDELINLVGELVIAGTSASVLAQRSREMLLMEANSSVGRLVEAIRDSALRLRMVEIGETFSRFRRVVHDVSLELGKDIELAITGADTELDKSVVEKIGDPLMHLVRNAIDHGIEPAEVRIQNGKPAKGTLKLNAFHDSGTIVIQVADDGRGMERERILRKAMEQGLVQPGQNLSDQEVLNLIFEPGFSTAEAVTNLSGRGVGMDVVRRNIEALRGTVGLGSQPGQGTTVSIGLPLTLAIIDGFLVGVGQSSYVIPQDMVMECLEMTGGGNGFEERGYIPLRGAPLPVLRLRKRFNVRGEPRRRESVVVVQFAGQKAGLVVDELKGELQTVIKPLGRLFGHLKGISGSTILGTGEVALIVDVPSLIDRAMQAEAAECDTASVS
jgi:two-component system, chemotaxis family, sensor kinase CheA